MYIYKQIQTVSIYTDLMLPSVHTYTYAYVICICKQYMGNKSMWQGLINPEHMTYNVSYCKLQTINRNKLY